MRKTEDGRSDPAASPALVIRVEGAAPKKKPKKKPKRRWLRIWGAMLAIIFIASISAAVAVALSNANAPRELPPCNDVDPDAVRCDHFWLRPAEPIEGGAA
jgi:hypothetical protein